MISLINAGPGTGKTFTIVNGFLTLSDNLCYKLDPTDEQQDIFNFLQEEYSPNCRVVFFSHSNSVKDTLIKRLPKGTSVYTFHGAGMSQVIKAKGYQQPNNRRLDKFIEAITGHSLFKMDKKEKFAWMAVKKLVEYLKVEMLQPTEENYTYLLSKYPDLATWKFPVDWIDKAESLLNHSKIPNGSLTYADMVWLGALLTTRPIYDLGFVDESQDISRSSYTLVTRMCKNVVCCGDRNQAINAFAGASEEMYSHIESVSDAVLPLKSTLRNPPYIVDKANLLRPGGVAYGPKEANGEEKEIRWSKLPTFLAKLSPKKTLIVSRTNNMLIYTAIKLHKAEVPCQILDKDLADTITGFVKSFKTKTLPDLSKKLDEFVNRAKWSRNNIWVEMAQDKADCIRHMIRESSTIKDLLALIQETFQPAPNGFTLTTIHKAKGLEAENVVILNPPIELPACMEHPIQREQEINLHFVGITRVAKNLYWVKN